MSVVCDASSVVIRRDRLEACYPGGLERLLASPPNLTVCNDDDLVRVGFMAPYDVKNYVLRMARLGLRYVVDGLARDLVVVDQLHGLMAPCDWLDVIHFYIDGDREKAVTAAVWKGKDPDPLVAPDGWTIEQSRELERGFVPNGQLQARAEFVGTEDGLEVYRDRVTGVPLYVGRTSGH